jgi:hypothetical protein
MAGAPAGALGMATDGDGRDDEAAVDVDGRAAGEVEGAVDADDPLLHPATKAETTTSGPIVAIGRRRNIVCLSLIPSGRGPDRCCEGIPRAA